MSGELRVAVEIGPKGKKVAVWAVDWPGLQRGAKTSELAIKRLATYVPRYTRVVQIADMADAFELDPMLVVVDEYSGTGSTDYWGISFGHSDLDRLPMSDRELERQLTLLQASWTYFDEVRAQVSEVLRKGPRGGGKDREDLVRHVIGAEYDMAWKVSIPALPTGAWRDDANLHAYRDDFLAAIRQYHAEEKMGRNWPLHYLIRHTAYHTLDHTWEMEDRDLTNAG